MSMLVGVVTGVGRVEDWRFGVDGEVVVGIVYESLTWILSRVMVAMIGWRREF